jgi:DedD protein
MAALPMRLPMDSALKQRLLGAAVLVALAIIFVPMFLGNAPPKPDSAIQNLDIPPLPERKFETRTLTVEPPATAAPVAPARPSDKLPTVDTKAPPTFEAPDADKPGADKGAKVPAPAVAPPKTPATDNKPAVTETKPAADTKAPVAETPAVPGGRFSINLGIYADQAHANALIAKVTKLGFVAYSESTEYQGKSAQRVRVGPFADRAAAESARLKIKQAEPKAPSSVTESAEAQPAVDAPATAVAADRAGGWAVQLGAFKSEAEANKLRDRVRTVSMASFVDRSGTGDDTRWRVRAGPYADRAGAESARATLKQKLQTDGMIVTQP